MNKIIVLLLTILLSNSLSANDTINPRTYSGVISKQIMLHALDNAYKFAYFGDLEQYMRDDLLLIVERDSVYSDEIYGPRDKIAFSLTYFYRQIEYDMYEVYSKELDSCAYEYLIICYVNEVDGIVPVSMLVKTDNLGLIYCLILN